MSNENDISKKLRGLRMRLSPLLNDDAKSLLIQAEKLTGGVSTQPGNFSKKLKRKSNPTKKELKEKFNQKGLI